jgi:hypothetical protein
MKNDDKILLGIGGTAAVLATTAVGFAYVGLAIPAVACGVGVFSVATAALGYFIKQEATQEQRQQVKPVDNALSAPVGYTTPQPAFHPYCNPNLDSFGKALSPEASTAQSDVSSLGQLLFSSDSKTKLSDFRIALNNSGDYVLQVMGLK